MKTGFSGKTLWDWLELLIVPLFVAATVSGGVFWLNAKQSSRDRSIAADQAREETLRTYFQQMSDLLTAAKSSRVSTLETTVTLTALRRLDGRRKALVVQFLAEAHLITVRTGWARCTYFERLVHKKNLCTDPNRLYPLGGTPRLDLGSADLEGADFHGLGLPSSVSFPSGRPPVTEAVSLEGADLRNAVFRRADLTATSLQDADLRGADFSEATLSGVSLESTCLSGAHFAHASMQPATGLPATDFYNAEGVRVDFSGARLDGVDFSGTRLTSMRRAGASTRGTRWPKSQTATEPKSNLFGHPCSDLPHTAR